MKILTAVLSLSLISTSAFASKKEIVHYDPAAIAGLTQKLINEVIKNDSLIVDAKAGFVSDQTDIENNRVLTSASMTLKQKTFESVVLPGEAVPSSTAQVTADSGYQAYMNEDHYGVKTAGKVEITMDVVKAFRLAAKQFKNTFQWPKDENEVDAAAAFAKIEVAKDIDAVYDGINELNAISKRALNHEMAKRLEDREGGAQSALVRRCRQYATPYPGSNPDQLEQVYQDCMDRDENEFNSFEQTRVLQDSSPLVHFNSESGPGFKVEFDNAGKVLTSLAITESCKVVTGIDVYDAAVAVTANSITVSTHGDVAIDKLQYLKIDQKFKKVLAAYQNQDPEKVDYVKSFLTETLVQFKKAISAFSK